jgi:hypothetical protein
MNKGTSKAEKKQASREMETRCWRFLQPVLAELQKRLDRRLVKTVLDLVLVIVMHRHRNNGLVLSELGEHLLGSDRGPAGVKRIASVLHSSRWQSQIILRHRASSNERVKKGVFLTSHLTIYRRCRDEPTQKGNQVFCLWHSYPFVTEQLKNPAEF